MITGQEALDYLLSGFIPEGERDNFDLDTAIDRGFGEWHIDLEVMVAGRAYLAEVLAQELPAAELHYRVMPMCGVPGGRDIEAFLHYVLLRIDEVIASGADKLIVPWRRTPANGISPVHRARFTDDETARSVSQQVLARHEARVRAWAADPGGTPRLHLVAELADQVGWVTPTDDRGDVVADPQPARQAVVLLGHDPTPGSPLFEVLTAYAETSVDPEVRGRYPDLCTLFGGFFGQERAAIDGQILWNAEYRLHELTGVEVVGRMADQLQRLLVEVPLDDEPDPDLRRLVHSLGACTQPTIGVRAWLEGLAASRSSEVRRRVPADLERGARAGHDGTSKGSPRGRSRPARVCTLGGRVLIMVVGTLGSRVTAVGHT
jgi:hypothetical protein